MTASDDFPMVRHKKATDMTLLSNETYLGMCHEIDRLRSQHELDQDTIARIDATHGVKLRGGPT